MERLFNIIDELKEANIINEKIHKSKKHIMVEVNTSGNDTLWSYLAGKFRALGYEVESEGWNYMRIYYNNKREIIDEIFEKYNI